MESFRIGEENRITKETQIRLSVNLDGAGQTNVKTGIPFFDHMLDLLGCHGLIDLMVEANGDLEVDYHHTVEDVGLAFGTALKKALGDKAGIERYGFFILPMDECLSRVVLDLGGRPFLHYRVQPENAYVRDFNILLAREFFQAFANASGSNLHIELLHGSEPHHIAESIFKAFGRALASAVAINPRRSGVIPSTKGLLE
jgi:imidazoleglycerol-phosphate dehydratase